MCRILPAHLLCALRPPGRLRREDSRVRAEETGSGSGSPAGRGEAGPAAQGPGVRRQIRPAEAGFLQPRSHFLGSLGPGGRTMSWLRAALRGTRLVRSGSASKGGFGGVVGAADSGYGARRAEHGGFGEARKRVRRGAEASQGSGPSGGRGRLFSWRRVGPRKAAGARGWWAVNDALNRSAFLRIV